MRATVVAMGTRGDVEPHLALAAGLVARGHRTTVVAPLDLESQAKALGRGVDFLPIGVAFREIYRTPEGAALLASGNRPWRFLRRLTALAFPIAEQIVAGIREGCRGADVVLYSPLGMPAYYLARDAGIPSFATVLQPLGRTRTSPSPLFPFPVRLPGSLNLLSHRVTEQLFWQLCRPLMAKTFGYRMPVMGHYGDVYRSNSPLLFGYSPAVVPRPKDFGPEMHVTGFWTAAPDRHWKAPARLMSFLAAGPAPICIGFGSVNSSRIERILPHLYRAAIQSGRRVILLTGWWDGEHGAAAFGDAVYVTDTVPHSWLFPRVVAVVHHGGAGTTAAALRAGVPSIVIPFFFDQRFWGGWLHRQGFGPAPIGPGAVSTAAVARALAECDASIRMRQRLAEVRRALREEDGVGTALDIIEARCSAVRTGALPMVAT